VTRPVDAAMEALIRDCLARLELVAAAPELYLTFLREEVGLGEAGNVEVHSD